MVLFLFALSCCVLLYVNCSNVEPKVSDAIGKRSAGLICKLFVMTMTNSGSAGLISIGLNLKVTTWHGSPQSFA